MQNPQYNSWIPADRRRPFAKSRRKHCHCWRKSTADGSRARAFAESFLGNVGKTVAFTESAEANPVNQTESLRELIEALKQNEVEALIILGGNPVFTAPADFQFAENLSRAKFKAHLSSDLNETSALCDWHIPQNHFLESWSDARAFDGTISIVQPLILPLYAGKSAHEILDAMISPPGRNDYDIVHDFWNSKNPGSDFENKWRQALHDGLIANTKLPEKKFRRAQFNFHRQNNFRTIWKSHFCPTRPFTTDDLPTMAGFRNSKTDHKIGLGQCRIDFAGIGEKGKLGKRRRG